MADDLSKFNVVHRLRLYAAEAKGTQRHDLAATLDEAREEIFRLRLALANKPTSEEARLLEALGAATIALVEEAKAALDALPQEGKDGK